LSDLLTPLKTPAFLVIFMSKNKSVASAFLKIERESTVPRPSSTELNTAEIGVLEVGELLKNISGRPSSGSSEVFAVGQRVQQGKSGCDRGKPVGAKISNYL